MSGGTPAGEQLLLNWEAGGLNPCGDTYDFYLFISYVAIPLMSKENKWSRNLYVEEG